MIHRRDDETHRTDRAAAARALGGSTSPRRPLYVAVADPGSLDQFGEQTRANDPARWPEYPAQLRRARAVTGAPHAVTTGVATVGGHACVLIGFEFPFLGGSVGEAEGAKIAAAFGLAVSQGLPVVSVAASGGMRMQEGTSSLVQMHVIAAAIAAARRAGIPHVAVAGNPTTGGMWASLVASADVIIGTDGAQVSFSGSRTRPEGADPAAPEFAAEGQHAGGFLDLVVPADRLREEVTAVVGLLSPRTRGAAPASAPLPDAAEPAGPVSGWAQVSRARGEHTGTAARAEEWLADYFASRFEIRGDRAGAVDRGLRCGFGSRDGATLGFIAQTGRPTTAAGFRTAARLLTLAERFDRPVLTLIDTPGAASGPQDEAAGVGPAIAELLVAVASASVPVTSVIVGEGVSGGALALASPGELWLTAEGYLAVTSPEHAASILKLPASAAPQVAEQLRLTPADLVRQGIARGIVRQPPARAGQSCDPR
ncbi:MAG TPA: carboxyl transferase domain-containing protein [Trebonia sp.]|nr:carboxyl transferase domain-containing protein [Trebonia sp.]